MLRMMATGVAVIALLGCNSPDDRLNAPPHGDPVATSDLQGTFVYMADNALLNDMTVSDIHFMPHRARLTTLGVERLSRLTSLIQAYGGQVRFSTSMADEALRTQRMNTIVEFLASSGIPSASTAVVADMPGNVSMTANEAVLIRTREGMYQEKSSGSASPEPPTGATP